MLRAEGIALELFEYKIAELRSTKRVAGGVAALWELSDHIEKQLGGLDPDELRRFERAQRLLRHALQSTGSESQRRSAAVAELVIGEPEEEVAPEDPVIAAAHAEAPQRGTEVEPRFEAEEAAEREVLRRLARKVWLRERQRFMEGLAASLRAEREHHVARLLFALHRNLALHMRRLHGDGQSRPAFRMFEPMPAQGDALFSASDPGVLLDLVQTTVDTIERLADPAGPFAPLRVGPGAELASFRSLARAVAADPYAGKLSPAPTREASSGQLRLAIAELNKERLPEAERAQQRRRLEDRLQQSLAHERRQRGTFARDVAHFGSLLDDFLERLERCLPTSVGGKAAGERLPGGVLFAANPALRATDVESGASAITVRLKGATRLRMGELDLSLSAAGSSVKLFIAGQGHDLGEDGLSLELGRLLLEAYREGGYVHLRLEDEGRSLAERLAEAWTVLLVRSSPAAQDLLRVLAVLASGRVGDATGAVRGALESVAPLVRSAPDRAWAVRGLLEAAVPVAGVTLPRWTAEKLIAALSEAASPRAREIEELLSDKPLEGVAIHPIGTEPLALEVATHSLTVRTYRPGEGKSRGSLVATLPGQVLGIFDEYLVERLGDGFLLCVRGEGELLTGYLPARDRE